MSNKIETTKSRITRQAQARAPSATKPGATHRRKYPDKLTRRLIRAYAKRWGKPMP